MFAPMVISRSLVDESRSLPPDAGVVIATARKA